LFNEARKRARKSGVPFNITQDDIVIPTHCPALGIPLVTGNTGGPNEGSDNSPSLDRLVPDLGYTRGNIIVISRLANSIKYTATSEQIRAVSEWLKSLGR
jgi:hypothetical protein